MSRSALFAIAVPPAWGNGPQRASTSIVAAKAQNSKQGRPGRACRRSRPSLPAQPDLTEAQHFCTFVTGQKGPPAVTTSPRPTSPDTDGSMAYSPSVRPTREWPLALVAVLVVGLIGIPLWQNLAAGDDGGTVKWTADRISRLFLGPEQ